MDLNEMKALIRAALRQGLTDQIAGAVSRELDPASNYHRQWNKHFEQVRRRQQGLDLAVGIVRSANATRVEPSAGQPWPSHRLQFTGVTIHPVLEYELVEGNNS